VALWSKLEFATQVLLFFIMNSEEPRNAVWLLKRRDETQRTITDYVEQLNLKGSDQLVQAFNHREDTKLLLITCLRRRGLRVGFLQGVGPNILSYVGFEAAVSATGRQYTADEVDAIVSGYASLLNANSDTESLMRQGLKETRMPSQHFAPQVPIGDGPVGGVDLAAYGMCAACAVDVPHVRDRRLCRVCGRVFCDRCTQQRMLLPASWNQRGTARVCNSCAIGLSAIHQARIESTLASMPGEASFSKLRLDVDELQLLLAGYRDVLCVSGQVQGGALATCVPIGDRPPPFQNAATTRYCTACHRDLRPTARCPRHHCRACGRVFCPECTQQRMLLPASWGYDVPARVCNSCGLGLSAYRYLNKRTWFSMENECRRVAQLFDEMRDHLNAGGIQPEELEQDESVLRQAIESAKALIVITVSEMPMIGGICVGSGLMIVRPSTDHGWSPPMALESFGLAFSHEDVGKRLLVPLYGDEAMNTLIEAPDAQVPMGGLPGMTFAGLHDTAEQRLQPGTTMHGAYCQVRQDVHLTFYGKNTQPAKILAGSMAPPPVTVPLFDALEYLGLRLAGKRDSEFLAKSEGSAGSRDSDLLLVTAPVFIQGHTSLSSSPSYAGAVKSKLRRLSFGRSTPSTPSVRAAYKDGSHSLTHKAEPPASPRADSRLRFRSASRGRFRRPSFSKAVSMDTGASARGGRAAAGEGLTAAGAPAGVASARRPMSPMLRQSPQTSPTRRREPLGEASSARRASYTVDLDSFSRGRSRQSRATSADSRTTRSRSSSPTTARRLRNLFRFQRGDSQTRL